MVKFFPIALTAFAAVASAQEPPKSARTACDTVNFKSKAADFALLNNLVDVAISSGMLTTKLAPMDPLVVQNKTLSTMSVHKLGADFTITPFINTFNVTGLAKTIPRKFEVVSDKTLKTGVDINGTLAISSTISLEIQQQNKSAWQPCWTSVLHQQSCPPKVIQLDVDFAITNPSIGATLDMEMRQCSPNAPAGTCTDVTVNDLISAATNQKFPEFFPRVLHRTKTASIKEISLNFATINTLAFKCHSDDHYIMDAINNMLSSHTAEELNDKQGDTYRKFISHTQETIKARGNQMIATKFQPQFADTCYEDIMKN